VISAPFFLLTKFQIMARIQYGSIVSNIRGSVGGTTFQNNKYGFTVKSKSNPGNGSSIWRAGIKNSCITAVQAWSTLDPEVQTTWNSFAATHPQPVKHNPTSYLSGYALFIKWQMSLLAAGQNMNFTPSFIIQDQNTYEPTLTIGNTGLTVNLHGLNAIFDVYHMISMSIPYPSFRAIQKNALRLIQSVPLPAQDYNISDSYMAHFGRLPASQNEVLMSVRCLVASAPWFYEPVYFKVVVQQV
jgi:hypothetical protein